MSRMKICGKQDFLAHCTNHQTNLDFKVWFCTIIYCRSNNVSFFYSNKGSTLSISVNSAWVKCSIGQSSLELEVFAYLKKYTVGTTIPQSYYCLHYASTITHTQDIINVVFTSKSEVEGGAQ